jgi:anthranilate phosphoribosyltransferase
LEKAGFIKKILKSEIRNEESFTAEDVREFFDMLEAQTITDAEIALFLTYFILKGASLKDLIFLQKELIKRASRVNLTEETCNNSDNNQRKLEVTKIIDLCGTGGDGKNTFNISTISSFIAASVLKQYGIGVAKHGNTALTGRIGSSNVLESVGITFSDIEAELKLKLQRSGYCYLHAPLFHPALKRLGPVRKQLGIRSVFNILGPLLNPAKPDFQLCGVADMRTFDLYSGFFKETLSPFLIVYALDGYDEISLTGDFLIETVHGRKQYTLEEMRESYGVVLPKGKITPQDLVSRETAQDNAELFLTILKGEGTNEQSEVVIVNAAFAIFGALSSIPLQECIMYAREALFSKAAHSVFNDFRSPLI